MLRLRLRSSGCFLSLLTSPLTWFAASQSVWLLNKHQLQPRFNSQSIFEFFFPRLAWMITKTASEMSTSVQPLWVCSSICVVSRTNFPQVCPRILTLPLQRPLLLVPIQTCSFLMSETQVCRELRVPGGSSPAFHTSKRRWRKISKRVARGMNPLLKDAAPFSDGILPGSEGVFHPLFHCWLCFLWFLNRQVRTQ